MAFYVFFFFLFLLQNEQGQAPAFLIFFFPGRVAVLLLLNHLWQWLGKNTRINISWQPGINLPYKVTNPPFKNQRQSLKNAALGDLVWVWHSEQAVLDSGKLSPVQRRDQLYTHDQVLQQSNHVVSTMVSEHRINRRDLLESPVWGWMHTEVCWKAKLT